MATCGATRTLSSTVAWFERRRRSVAKPGGGLAFGAHAILWGLEELWDDSIHPCRRSRALKNETSKSIARPNVVSAPRILVVEDEIDVALLIAYNLEAEGYVVESVARGDEAELRLAESAPDLLILDWMLPGVSGIEICRRLRARETTRTLPVIMVTARHEESERVRGLAVGADDYVVKPFSVIELMARVHALLRRSRPERVAERLYVGDLDLDRLTRRVRRGDRDIHLAPTDFRLLEHLLEKPGRVFSRAQLLDLVWGRSAEVDERTVDVHIGRLRKKLSKGRERDPIRTVRGAGYAIDEGFGPSDRR
jgi:two-component system, OmpR family, phosphate regulon response regulator PhoB